MKVHTSLIRAWLIAAALVCSFSACVGPSGAPPAGYVFVPELPKWQAPVDATPVGWGEVAGEVQRLAPGAVLMTSDATFTRINHQFAREIVQWTLAVYRSRKDRNGREAFVAESWDCDKFCKALTLAIELAAADAGVKAQPLAARVFVNQMKAWANVASGGGHAVAGLATDAGILIIEPQNGQDALLEQYPNRATVWRVNIGG